MSVEIHRNVCVVGIEGDPLSKGLLLEVESVGGIDMIAVKENHKMKKLFPYIGNMCKHLEACRQEAVTMAMRMKFCEPNPSTNVVEPTAPLPKRPRRSMADELPPFVEVTVPLMDEEPAKVKMRTEWHAQSTLTVELSDATIAMLQCQPLADNKMKPVIDQPNVAWHASRQSVSCWYFDKASKKGKRKVMAPKADPDPIVFQENVNRMAAVCQKFYDEHNEEMSDESHGVPLDHGEKALSE